MRKGLLGDEDAVSAYSRLHHAGFKSGEIVGVLKRFAKSPGLVDRCEPPEPDGHAE